ncbi:MAG: hypothetical protein LUF00_06195 [Lachnospiraceae bacterium]|nr:hypothetical protein [Lachnospiraceae bacterium]
MFRLWAKELQDNHLLRDTVIVMDGTQSRTKKVLGALEQVCVEFDLQVPIWLDSNIREFQRRAKTRFSQDNFVESVPFDYLEIHVIEED